jgi:hypothetical protein
MSDEMKRLTEDLKKDAALRAESKKHAGSVQAFVIFVHHKGYKITEAELRNMKGGELSDDDLTRVVAGSAPVFPEFSLLPVFAA